MSYEMLEKNYNALTADQQTFIYNLVVSLGKLNAQLVEVGPRKREFGKFSGTGRASFSEDWEMSEEEFLEYFNDTKVLFEPESGMGLSGTNYILLARILEQVTGQSYEEYMKENIFDPSGMTETLYFEAGRDIPRMAHGYIPEDEVKTQWKEYDYGEESFFGTKADGGIYTSINEFVKWEKALRNNIIISDSLKQIAHSAITPVSGSTFSSYQNRPHTSYGYGWFIEEVPGWPKKVYHTGDNGGFQIYAGRFPEKEILVLVFENRNDNSRWNMVKEIDAVLKETGLLD